jgi:hypothetical protein
VPFVCPLPAADVLAVVARTPRLRFEQIVSRSRYGGSRLEFTIGGASFETTVPEPEYEVSADLAPRGQNEEVVQNSFHPGLGSGAHAQL